MYEDLEVCCSGPVMRLLAPKPQTSLSATQVPTSVGTVLYSCVLSQPQLALQVLCSIILYRSQGYSVHIRLLYLYRVKHQSLSKT